MAYVGPTPLNEAGSGNGSVMRGSLHSHAYTDLIVLIRAFCAPVAKGRG